MAVTMERRQWLKSTALAAAGLAVARKPLSGTPGAAAGNDELVFLDQNENPYGISGRTEKAIAEAIKLAHRYPGDETAELRDMIAKQEGVSKEQVVLGAGSTEIFSLALLLFGSDGKEVLLPEPTYSGFKSYVEKLKGKLNSVPVDDRYEMDLDGMARSYQAGTSLVYACNPNNPTGTIVDGTRLRSFCEEMAGKSFVFVDEAYHELVEDPRYSSMMDLVRKGANVMVARTFSKIHGLAGMRIGYGIGKPEVVAEFRRVQTNFAPISQVSLAAAKASYVDSDWISLSQKRNAEARTFLYRLLDRHGHKAILGSQTNFVAYEVAKKPALVVEDFKKQGIQLRPFEFLGKNWIRISMGTVEEMEKLAAAMQKLS